MKVRGQVPRSKLSQGRNRNSGKLEGVLSDSGKSEMELPISIFPYIFLIIFDILGPTLSLPDQIRENCQECVKTIIFFI